jgi:hypothetical protein
MKPQPYHSAALALALLPLACLTSACHPIHAPEQLGWHSLQSGDYMREEYIQAVTDTRSPYKAWQEMGNAYVETVSIANDKDGLSLAIGYDFHEGSGPVQPETNGTISLSGDDSPYSLHVLNGNGFILSNNKSSMKFRYVGDWQKWANKTVIAGTYQDAKGQLYTFHPNGQAQFPGNQAFDYSVGLDMILTNYDYIYSKKMKKTWAFIIDSNKIKLFDVDLDKNEPNGLVSSKPRWVLKKLTSQQP